MSIFSYSVQTGEKPWPSSLLSEPVHHCHSGSAVQNSSFLSCWSLLDPPGSARVLISLSGLPADSLLLQLIPVCWPLRSAPATDLSSGGGGWGEAAIASRDRVTRIRIRTPRTRRRCRMRATVATCQKSNPRCGRENAAVLRFT